MKNILIITILLFSVVLANAQEEKKKTKKVRRAEKEAKKIDLTKTLVENEAFVFVPTQAIPTGMSDVNLTYSFSATIKNDSINCYLPFYGRAYTAEFGGSNSPMDFEHAILNYSTKKSKKGSRIIKFDVKNKNDLLNFTFQIAETGSASLSVTSTNRAAISYYGNISEIKEK